MLLFNILSREKSFGFLFSQILSFLSPSVCCSRSPFWMIKFFCSQRLGAADDELEICIIGQSQKGEKEKDTKRELTKKCPKLNDDAKRIAKTEKSYEKNRPTTQRRFVQKFLSSPSNLTYSAQELDRLMSWLSPNGLTGTRSQPKIPCIFRSFSFHRLIPHCLRYFSYTQNTLWQVATSNLSSSLPSPFVGALNGMKSYINSMMNSMPGSIDRMS